MDRLDIVQHRRDAVLVAQRVTGAVVIRHDADTAIVQHIGQIRPLDGAAARVVVARMLQAQRVAQFMDQHGRAVAAGGELEVGTVRVVREQIKVVGVRVAGITAAHRALIIGPQLNVAAVAYLLEVDVGDRGPGGHGADGGRALDVIHRRKAVAILGHRVGRHRGQEAVGQMSGGAGRRIPAIVDQGIDRIDAGA